MPGVKLIGDISRFPIGEGWLYLATVIDLRSKELVGHAITPRMRAEFAIDTITTAHRSGSRLDGAAAESFFATIKTEIGAMAWPDRATARRDIENWIKFYNERRLHSSIGYLPPTETRRAWEKRMPVAI